MTDFINDGIASSSPEEPLSIIMIDLDYFKNINDILGHETGDRALITFSEALRSTFAGKDAIIGRWGGDEFIVAGKEKDLSLGFRERLSDALESNDDLCFKLSYSAGAYLCTSPAITCEQALMEVDSVLYKDKDEHHKDAEDFANKLREIKGTRRTR